MKSALTSPGYLIVAGDQNIDVDDLNDAQVDNSLICTLRWV